LLCEAIEMGTANALEKHLKKYLILYTIASLLIAMLLGWKIKFFTSISNNVYSDLIEVLAISTILPSAVTMKGGELIEVARSFNKFKAWSKGLLVTLASVYLLSPLLAWGLSYFFSNKTAALGFFLANIVPGSSAALGYIMLASGNMELAVMLILLLAFLDLGVTPAYMALYSSAMKAEVPLGPVVESLVIVLVLPIIVGQLIRYYASKEKSATYVDKTLRPYLSITTMLSMLTLIFFLIARKTTVLIKEPGIAGSILGLQAILILITIGVLLPLDKLLRLSYGDHQVVAFLSISKNESVAAAIATTSLSGGMAALAPALIPAIQPVMAILYLHMEGWVRRYFSASSDGKRSQQPSEQGEKKAS